MFAPQLSHFLFYSAWDFFRFLTSAELAFTAVFASQIYALATLRLPPFSGKDKTSLAKYFSKNLGIAYGCTQNFSRPRCALWKIFAPQVDCQILAPASVKCVLVVRKTAKATRSNQLQITHFIKYTDMKKKTSKKSEAPLKEVVEQAVEQITWLRHSKNTYFITGW